MLSFQKVFGKVCCTNGALPKKLTKADEGGRGGQPIADKS